MTVKDLWLACNNWEDDTVVLVHRKSKSEPERYENMWDVKIRYFSQEVEWFSILENDKIAILLRENPLPF